MDRFVHNIKQVYALTGNETGYSALKADWDFRRQNKVGNLHKFSDEQIRENILEKVTGPIGWLYQHNNWQDDFSSGFTGSLVTFYLSVTPGDAFDNYKWSYSYNLSVNIGSGNQNTLEK